MGTAGATIGATGTTPAVPGQLDEVGDCFVVEAGLDVGTALATTATDKGREGVGLAVGDIGGLREDDADGEVGDIGGLGAEVGDGASVGGVAFGRVF